MTVQPAGRERARSGVFTEGEVNEPAEMCKST